MLKRNWFILPAILGNIWIYKMFSSSFLIGIICTATTLLAWIYLQKNSRLLMFFVFLLTIVTMFLQYKTTSITPLTYLDNDEQRVQQMRLKEHPPVFLSFPILQKKIYIPTANWFELRKEPVVIQKLQKNFGEIFSLNLYFFSNHPRERVGISEFEKFPYFWLPVFLIGLYIWFNRKLGGKIMLISALLLVLPIMLITYTGHKNPLGPFSLFPFITLTTAIGLQKISEYLQKKRGSIYLITLTLAFFALILLQTLAYDFY